MRLQRPQGSTDILSVFDDSFCSTLLMSETDLPVLPDGWRYDLDSLTVLRVKGNVDPHTDSYVGGAEDIKDERSIFWLLDDRSKKPSWLMAGSEAIRMKPDEWAFFDHQETHAFMASATWIGISVQVYR